MNTQRLLQRAYRYGQGYVQLRRGDTLLVSFPKSGNTWLKYILANYIESFEKEQPGELTFKRAKEIVPELGVNDLHDVHALRSGLSFIKTHALRNPLMNAGKSLLLLRHPKKVMVSYFFFAQANKNIRFQDDFQAFIRHPKFGLEAWLKHTLSWYDRSVILHYEDLQDKGVEVLFQVMKKLNHPADESKLAEAFALSTKEHMSRIEKSDPTANTNTSDDYSFVGKGTRGKWEDLATAEDEELFKEIFAKAHATRNLKFLEYYDLGVV